MGKFETIETKKKPERILRSVCVDCKWWDDEYAEEEEQGECHKNPPLSFSGEERGQWPKVFDSDFCSKFENGRKDVQEKKFERLDKAMTDLSVDVQRTNYFKGRP